MKRLKIGLLGKIIIALALMIMQGMDYNFGMFMGFVCMLGITMVAAPGVPGGAIAIIIDKLMGDR